MEYTLYNDDCMNILPTLEDGSIDAIITDLPYGRTICDWDEMIDFTQMWFHVKRLLRKNGVFVTTAVQPFTSKLIMSNLSWFKYCWVWNKNNSSAFAVVKYRPFLVTEDICVFAASTHTYNPQMVVRGGNHHKRMYGGARSELYSIKPKAGEYGNYYQPKNIISITKHNGLGNLHPTQKPVRLYEYLILTYTNEGETVLDFTMGSGTTGVACIQTNRNFIGVEIDPKYHLIAKERIEKMYQSIRKKDKSWHAAVAENE